MEASFSCSVLLNPLPHRRRHRHLLHQSETLRDATCGARPPARDDITARLYLRPSLAQHTGGLAVSQVLAEQNLRPVYHSE